MKRSNSFHQNRFSDETRALFHFVYGCWLCGANSNLELDHITGRRFAHQASPRNAAMLCRKCHSTKKKSEISLLLSLTAQHLEEVGYRDDERDEEFNQYAEQYK